MEKLSREVICYDIQEIHRNDKTVRVETSLPWSMLRNSRPRNFLFPDPSIKVEDLRPVGKKRSQYTVSFQKIKPELNIPPLYPAWHGDKFSLPLWCLMLLPESRPQPYVMVGLNTAAKRKNTHLICPALPAPAPEFGAFSLIGGYRMSKFALRGIGIYLYFANQEDQPYLKGLVKAVLSKHYDYFNQWLWPRIHLLFERQVPRMKKQKAMLFSAKDLAFGRYVLRSIQPVKIFEKVSQIDIIEHEILHYYIDTDSPAGSWVVEGLTTYLSRRLLFEAGLLTEEDWSALVKDAFKECRNNPLCHTTSLNTAPSRFWDARYGNVIYNKGFLLACLLDQELKGGLMAVAKDLFQLKVRYGQQFTEKDFFSRLPACTQRNLRRWLHKKDLRDDLRGVRILPGH
jgi:hypothetical protein